LQYKTEYIAALCKEITNDKRIQFEELSTLYFGGGTPSLLNTYDLDFIFNSLAKRFRFHSDCEITIEANPEHIEKNLVSNWKELGFNRLSLGIQSFNESDLHFLGRNHSVDQGINSLRICQEAGIENITIDLIYGLPDNSKQKFEKQIEIANEFQIPHISAYLLSIEENTMFHKEWKKGKMQFLDDDSASDFILSVINTLESFGYEQYEISNFCKDQKVSKHNSNYWSTDVYGGVGAGAHSFDGKRRYWNSSKIFDYINKINSNQIHYEFEELNEVQKYNEFVMTSLRTRKGINLTVMKEKFANRFNSHTSEVIGRLLESAVIDVHENFLIIPTQKIPVTDFIIEEFILDSDES